MHCSSSSFVAAGVTRLCLLRRGKNVNVINKGRFAMTALPPDFTPLQGGVPIKHGDQVMGAIGVSGAKSAAQDKEVAKAGVAAIEETKTASE